MQDLRHCPASQAGNAREAAATAFRREDPQDGRSPEHAGIDRDEVLGGVSCRYISEAPDSDSFRYGFKFPAGGSIAPIAWCGLKIRALSKAHLPIQTGIVDLTDEVFWLRIEGAA